MAETHDNMWSWVSALYFDKLHGPKGGKNPTLCSNEVWHFIPRSSGGVYYEHKARLALALKLRGDIDQGFVDWLLEIRRLRGLVTFWKIPFRIVMF